MFLNSCANSFDALTRSDIPMNPVTIIRDIIEIKSVNELAAVLLGAAITIVVESSAMIHSADPPIAIS
jgi:hypothetical protein